MLSRLIKSSSTRLVSEFGSSGAMKIPESDKYPGGDVFNGTVSAIVRMVGRSIVSLELSDFALPPFLVRLQYFYSPRKRNRKCTYAWMDARRFPFPMC